MNRNFGLKEKLIEKIAIPVDGIEDKHILHAMLSLYTLIISNLNRFKVKWFEKIEKLCYQCKEKKVVDVLKEHLLQMKKIDKSDIFTCFSDQIYGEIEFKQFVPQIYFRNLITDTLKLNSAHYGNINKNMKLTPDYYKSIKDGICEGDEIIIQCFCDTLKCVVFLLDIDSKKKELYLTRYTCNEKIRLPDNLILESLLYLPNRLLWIVRYDNKFNHFLHYSQNIENRECCICLIPLNIDENEIGMFQLCPHIFHFQCIKEWCKISNTCPLCKQVSHTIYKSNHHIISTEKLFNRNIVPKIDEMVCQVCRKGDNEYCLLLCDNCNYGYHTYCLGLQYIPTGDWYCPTCSRLQIRNRIQPNSMSERSKRKLKEESVSISYLSPEDIDKYKYITETLEKDFWKHCFNVGKNNSNNGSNDDDDDESLKPKNKKRKKSKYSSIFDYSKDEIKHEISCKKQPIYAKDFILYMDYLNTLDYSLFKSGKECVNKEKMFPLIHYYLKENKPFIEEYLECGLTDILMYVYFCFIMKNRKWIKPYSDSNQVSTSLLNNVINFFFELEKKYIYKYIRGEKIRTLLGMVNNVKSKHVKSCLENLIYSICTYSLWK